VDVIELIFFFFYKAFQSHDDKEVFLAKINQLTVATALLGVLIFPGISFGVIF
jgi:hypothetical protein